MHRSHKLAAFVAASAVLGGLTAGCSQFRQNYCAQLGDYSPKPLGTISDPIWQTHETNAEASDFVVHEHEFIGNSAKLNKSGEEHVKQIAARAAEVPFPILVEPSSMSVQEGSKYRFPIHNDPELDLQRRGLIVQALVTLGVQDAENRVLVSPALTPGFEEFEGERAYNTGFSTWGGFGNGFGGFGGMGMGGGGFY